MCIYNNVVVRSTTEHLYIYRHFLCKNVDGIMVWGTYQHIYNMQITTIEVPNKNETRVFIIHVHIVLSRKRNDLKKRNIYNQKELYMHKIIKK